MNAELNEWLADLGLQQYAEIFESEDIIDLCSLRELSESDLKELGVSMGHRKKILHALEQPARSVRRIFLSYGHDKACEALVERMRHDLADNGYEVWIDKERINFGDDWRRQITEGVRASTHMLAFLSRHSTRTPGVCRQEVAIALGPLKGHVYTVLVEPLAEVTPPIVISHLQWLDMQNWQSLMASDPESFDVWYAEKLKTVLEVLKKNEPFAGEIDELKRWLKPQDWHTELIASEAQDFSGREWLMAGLDSEAEKGELERWRVSGSDKRVFWLAAEPGWGKTSVAIRLAHAARARVLAVHFCRGGHAATLNASTAIRSLAFQVATQLSDFRSLLLQRRKDGLTLNDMTAEELFQVLLRQPMQYLIDGGRGKFDRHLLVIDAIDESIDGQGRSELLHLIAEGFQQLPEWLGLVVTSRPDAPVVRKLGHYGINFIGAKDPRNLDDIASHLHRWLMTKGLEAEMFQVVFNNVLKAAAGNFLYLRQLEQAVDVGLIDLDSLSNALSVPVGLVGLYDRWFELRFPERRAFELRQRPLLELMVAAQSPLDLDVIKFVLGWDSYTCLQALEPLGSLCPVQDGKVYFFHKSVCDWLLDSNLSGTAWHVSAAAGHQRIADFLEKNVPSMSRSEESWPIGLLRQGAVHAALAQRPSLGVQLLITQTTNNSSDRLAAGQLRAAIDDFLDVISGCTSSALKAIPSDSLADLVSRTDNRKSLSFACDLLIQREGEWSDIFKQYPLDGRGATWVFASRWTRSILEDPEPFARQRWEKVRDIAIDGSHPLYLVASYTFKYVALSRSQWLSDSVLEPVCKAWTYSRLVATNLLLQLTLQGSSFPSTLQWSEFWDPVWEYNQIEVDLLSAAMQWKGLRSPRVPRPETVQLFSSLEAKRKTLMDSANLSSSGNRALSLFWESGVDLEQLASSLRVLEHSAESEQIFRLFLCSPIFEASEIAGVEMANRAFGFAEATAELIALADPEADCAWGALVGTCKVLLSSGETVVFFEVLNRFSRASNAQLRGQAAMMLAAWLRDSDDETRMATIRSQHDLLRRFLHDEDIWPVQEIFHLLVEFSPMLIARKIDWVDFFEADHAPVLSYIPDWKNGDHDWKSFEAAATSVLMKRRIR